MASPMLQSVKLAPTEYWNDSCSIEELEYAIEHGATGATTNPVIVGGVLKKEMHLWKDRILEIIKDNPTFSEVDVAWQLIEEMAVKGAEILKPVFDKNNGMKGRISIQTNAQYYRNAGKMAEQAIYFDTLAKNMQVKMPVTEAGVKAIEEATYNGVNINATVCFTVAQSLAVAEAVERGLKRREADGKDTSKMIPVCTIMVGRVDDWLKVVANKDDITCSPEALEWAGVAVMKNAYKIYNEKKYRTRLLAAAYRNHYQWSEFVGGNVVLTIPCKWAKRFNGSDTEVRSRINDEVKPEYIKELLKKFPDFGKAYNPDGLSPAEFETYGATARTLRQFHNGYHDLLSVIRDLMLPNPDV